MSTNGVNPAEDADMSECDGEKVVTMMDVLQQQEEFEEDANAVLGASDDKNCTYSKGYIKRQAIYACLTCCNEAKTDPSKRAGVCLACSLSCHENHELIELYTKRNFCCDCGNPKFNRPCQFTPNKPDLNEDNSYNQNFSGLYCVCHRPYPDPESPDDDEMIQCIICEDWLHASHLEASVPANDLYSEMICKSCMDKNEFLHDYSELAVNTENAIVDVVSLNNTINMDSSIGNGDSEKSQITNGDSVAEKSDIDMKETSLSEESDKTTLTEETQSKEQNDSDENSKANESKEQNDTDENMKENVPAEESIQVNNETVENNVKSADGEDNQVQRNKETSADDAEKAEEERLLADDDTSVIAEENNHAVTVESENNSSPEISNTIIETKEATASNVVETDNKSDLQDHNINESNTETEKSNNENLEKLEDNATNNAQVSTENIDKDKNSNDNSEDPVTKEETELVKNDENNSNETKDTQATENTKTTTEESNPGVLDVADDTNSKEQTTAETQDTEMITKDSSTEESEKTSDVINTNSDSVSESEKTSDVINTHSDSVSESETKETVEQMDVDNVTKEINDAPKETDNVTKEDNDEHKLTDNVDSCDNNTHQNNSDDTNETKETETTDKSELMLQDTISELTNETESNQDLITEDAEKASNNENKRKMSIEETSNEVTNKKPKLDEKSICRRPHGVKKTFKGATFWPSSFRHKLCTCSECISMYKDLSVLFLTDLEDTVTAYENLGKEIINGAPASQYEKGLQALSSLDRVQQINALTEYNKMRDKLLDFLKSFKDRKEIVKEEDIKAFFAGMKPKREPDGVYFCR